MPQLFEGIARRSGADLSRNPLRTSNSSVQPDSGNLLRRVVREEYEEIAEIHAGVWPFSGVDKGRHRQSTRDRYNPMPQLAMVLRTSRLYLAVSFRKERLFVRPATWRPTHL